MAQHDITLSDDIKRRVNLRTGTEDSAWTDLETQMTRAAVDTEVDTGGYSTTDYIKAFGKILLQLAPLVKRRIDRLDYSAEYQGDGVDLDATFAASADAKAALDVPVKAYATFTGKATRPVALSAGVTAGATFDAVVRYKRDFSAGVDAGDSYTGAVS